MEPVAGSSAAHHVPHDTGCLHEFRDRGLCRNQVGPEDVHLRGVPGLYCLEHYHDDDYQYKRALHRSTSQWPGQWLLYDILAALVSAIPDCVTLLDM